MFKKLSLIGAALAMTGTALIPATPAAAQGRYEYRDRDYRGYDRDYRDYRRDIRRARAECRRDLRRADNRWEYRRELRDCRRDLRAARRGHYRDHYDYRRYRRY